MTLLNSLKRKCSKLELIQKYIFWVTLIFVFFQKCSNLCKKYLGFLRMFNFTQLITEATRVTSNSSTLIDHILSNSCEKYASPELLALD